MRALRSAREITFPRRELAHTVNLRNTPEIRFILDQSIEYGVHISRLLREIVGDAMKIKASGGIRTVDTVLEMAEAGADRFGMSRSSAMRIYAALPER